MQLAFIAVARILPPDEGQDLLEYGLLAALIALFAMAAAAAVGNTIYNTFWQAIAQRF